MLEDARAGILAKPRSVHASRHCGRLVGICGQRKKASKVKISQAALKIMMPWARWLGAALVVRSTATFPSMGTKVW